MSPVAVLTEMDRLYEQMRSAIASAAQPREPIRDIPVKVHIRRPERDSWAYMGRGVVSQEITGQSSRVGALPLVYFGTIARVSHSTLLVVRSASSHKILTVFGEVSCPH